MEKVIWQKSTPEQKVVLITILMMANHDKKEWEWQGKRFEIQAGQFITSLDNLAKIAGVSTQNVRTALTKFKKYEFLTNESTKTGRLITVVNWGLYQSEQERPDKASNKDLTKSQQRANKELTTNKNEKNEKNINSNKTRAREATPKVRFADFVSMTNDEYASLVTKLGEQGAKRCIEILDNYKGSTAKTYANDYRAILNWVIERFRDEQQRANQGGGDGKYDGKNDGAISRRQKNVGDDRTNPSPNPYAKYADYV